MPASPALRPGRRPSVPALVLVTGTTALSTDTYIAALPAVRDALHTTASATQLTITACIAGMAIGQILLGPVSDARGRRRLILAATLVFAAMSVVCALTPSIGPMLAARLLQGAACGAGASVGRAMVTDTAEGRSAAATFGTLSSVSLVAPVAGPVIGGVLLTAGDWRSIFWFLAVVGLAMWGAALVGLPETLPAAARHPGGLRHLAARAGDLLADPRFIAPVGVQCLTTAGFFIYIGGSSLVLQSDLGISAATYTAVFAGNATAMIASSIAFRLLVKRVGPHPIRRVAVVVQTAAVLALVACAVLAAPRPPALWSVWLCLATMAFGLGAYLPANSAIAQEEGRRFPGAASALSGGLPFLVGSLTTPLTGLLGAETVLAMASGMGACFALAAVTGALTTRWHRPAPAEPLTPCGAAAGGPSR